MINHQLLDEEESNGIDTEAASHETLVGKVDGGTTRIQLKFNGWI